MTAPIEEPWLEITTRTGLKIECPGTVDLIQAVIERQTHPLGDQTAYYGRTSSITGEAHLLETSGVLHVRQFTKTKDPDRHERSLMKAASKRSSSDSEMPSQAAKSLSASPAKTGPSWRGGPGSVTIH